METELSASLDRVFIHENSRGTKLAERAFSFFPESKISWVSERPDAAAQGRLSSSEFSKSKKNLLITRFEGKFFKQCPGSQNVACCNYFVLNLGQQCNMNCSYCYLQSYINSPLMTVYSNIEDALGELRAMAAVAGKQPVRIGTGEVMDSLSLDEFTGHAATLIDFFRELPDWKLEFKTKSDNVGGFLDRPHAGNVVVSWSINPSYIVSREEHGTASLERRLSAARRAVEHGFRIAFHMDPVIWHPEWKENYSGLVDEIAKRFDPAELPHISLGALRFQPEQRQMMRERFGMQSLALQGEMFPSRDGKLRYDQTQRNEMFNFIIKRFREKDSRWRVWLCMESPESWISNFDAMPRQIPELETFFRPIPKSPALQPLGGLA
ncbi:MAG: radical SAM protein [Bdellovibrionia bacterium]